jgi:hypothetical protein
MDFIFIPINNFDKFEIAEDTMRDTNNKLDIDELAEKYQVMNFEILTFGDFCDRVQGLADLQKDRLVSEIRMRLISENIRIGGPDNDRILSSC